MSEASRGRGKKPVVPRGRGGRRTQAERDQISQAERERNAERDRQYAAEQNSARLAQERAERERRRRQEFSTRGRGRGRGGFMGNSVKQESSGPLSLGSTISANFGQGKAFPRPWAPSQRPGANSINSGISSGIGVHGSNARSGAERSSAPQFEVLDGYPGDELEEGGYLSSDIDEAGAGSRVPIEQINLISDDEGTDGEEGRHGPPVLLTRMEHRAREVHVKDEDTDDAPIKAEDVDISMTDAPTVPGKGKSKARDTSLEITGEREYRGVWRDPPVIKDEPMDDIPSARIFDKVKDDTKDTKIQIQQNTQRFQRVAKDFKTIPTFFTQEEEKEYLREVEDRKAMLQEFSDVARFVDEKPMYLFQFPPTLPSLVAPKSITIKDDPDGPSARAPPTASAANTKATAVEVKDDDDDEAKDIDPGKKKTFTPDLSIRPKHLPTLDSGAVGKFRVHKSGKVTIDWGGSKFIVQNGVAPQFLQSVVMVQADEPKAGHMPGNLLGVATAFGQPRGKLVVQPDWDEMLGDLKDVTI